MCTNNSDVVCRCKAKWRKPIKKCLHIELSVQSKDSCRTKAVYLKKTQFISITMKRSMSTTDDLSKQDLSLPKKVCLETAAVESELAQSDCSTLLLSLQQESTKTAKTDKETNETTAAKERQSNRCSGKECRRKLSLVDQTLVCKCGKTFCSRHRHASAHSCSYDYAKENADRLGKDAKEWQEACKVGKGNLQNKI